jgi:hypothetical protein
MMARFWLSIEGDDLWSAMMLLNAAAIPTIGAYYGNQPPSGLETQSSYRCGGRGK